MSDELITARRRYRTGGGRMHWSALEGFDVDVNERTGMEKKDVSIPSNNKTKMLENLTNVQKLFSNVITSFCMHRPRLVEPTPSTLVNDSTTADKYRRIHRGGPLSWYDRGVQCANDDVERRMALDMCTDNVEIEVAGLRKQFDVEAEMAILDRGETLQFQPPHVPTLSYGRYYQESSTTAASNLFISASTPITFIPTTATVPTTTTTTVYQRYYSYAYPYGQVPCGAAAGVHLPPSSTNFAQKYKGMGSFRVDLRTVSTDAGGVHVEIGGSRHHSLRQR
ncbi:hypothetical protein M422DRAFT_782497 [Sphaerobolus stellatus SS14]|uniref:Uncharacterized protein n=1 Tax=Sphaerobolus stellatus (strain SS14) TaxID=990650 RepID=A0A0C9V1M7_SPHS4|nr:hypothetical protein M422DRAFT_782497 [Sphaerobolus stellatus SS14]